MGEKRMQSTYLGTHIFCETRFRKTCRTIILIKESQEGNGQNRQKKVLLKSTTSHIPVDDDEKSVGG